jgi:hypothetical protein
MNKGNNKITELRAILQREMSQNSIAVLVANRFRLEQKSYLPLKLQ